MIPDPRHDLSTLPLPWLSSFDVGDTLIDGEHRALIHVANDLCILAQHQPPASVLLGAAHELIAIVETHFASEEALFPVIGYRGRRIHVREHLSIRESLTTLLLSDDIVDPPIAAATARLLLIEHIIRHDLGFKTWIQVARGD